MSIRNVVGKHTPFILTGMSMGKLHPDVQVFIDMAIENGHSSKPLVLFASSGGMAKAVESIRSINSIWNLNQDVIRKIIEKAMVAIRWSEQANISRIALPGATLIGLKWHKIRANHTDFRRCILQDCSIVNSFMEMSSLSRAHVTDSIFDHSYLSESDMDGAIFKETSFVETSIFGAEATNCKFDYCNMHHVHAINCNFTNSSLVGVNMAGGLMNGANFRNADITGTDFTGVDIDYIHIGNANVEDAINFNRS